MHVSSPGSDSGFRLQIIAAAVHASAVPKHCNQGCNPPEKHGIHGVPTPTPPPVKNDSHELQ